MATSHDPLNHTVAFDHCPVFRGLALMLEDARQGDSHGRWRGVLNSADRRAGVPEKYGKLSQAALYAGWLARKAGFLPANPPGRSTHELRSDAVAYKGPVGRPLAWWQLGMDVTNPDELIAVLKRLGYAPIRPYPTGSEAHHVNLSASPRARLIKRRRWAPKVVAKVVPKPKPTANERLAAKAAKYGTKYGLRIVEEAKDAGIPVSLGFALVQQESNFENVWGGDPAPNGGTTGWHLHRVTEADYKRYKARRGDHGQGGMQGVGLTQLTWYAYQDQADALGGCWKPTPQLRVAFLHLAELIKAKGKRAGIAAYNGSGPAAERYADSVLALEAIWHKRLA